MTPAEAAVLAEGLRNYPKRPTTPDLPDPGGRPDINELYGRLATLQGTPMDYSGVEKVNASRMEASRRNFGGGLAMSMLGGESMKEPGAALFKKSLEQGDPIRANLADVGYIDHETGQFVENPMVERNRQEKVVSSRIDALVKEQEGKMKIALAQGKADESAVIKQNMEILKIMALGISQQNANTASMLAEARAAKLGQGKSGKPLTLGEQRGLNSLAASQGTLGRLSEGFKDEYSGGITGTPGAEIENYAARNFPKLMGSVMGKKSVTNSRAQAEWWAEQKYFDELPERHKIFGATLTHAENIAWKSAAIQPGMDPKDIRANLKKRADILASAIESAREMHVEDGRFPGAVDAALKFGGIPTQPRAPAAPAAVTPRNVPGLNIDINAIDAELARRPR